MLEVFKKVLPAILILLAVGVLTGTWIISGIVPMFIFYGLKILSPNYFLISASLLTSLIALVTGTSWGTVGTIGVALMGVAQGFNIPLPIAAGAILVGAYFGDKLSPFSETANMASLIVGVSVYQHIRHMLYTTIPAYLISLMIYWGLSQNYQVSQYSPTIMEISKGLTAAFNFNWLLLCSPLIILVAVIMKKDVVISMLFSSFVAAILAIQIQGANLKTILITLWQGYSSNTSNLIVDKILSRGGMKPMVSTAIIAASLFLLINYLLQKPKFRKIQEKLINKELGTGNFIFSTVIAILVVIITTGLSYLAIFIPGELFIGEYNRRRIAPQTLSRTLEDCGTAIAPLIPWGIGGIFISKTLGVPTIEYLPYAFMCYLSVIIAVIYGYLKIFIYQR